MRVLLTVLKHAQVCARCVSQLDPSCSPILLQPSPLILNTQTCRLVTGPAPQPRRIACQPWQERRVHLAARGEEEDRPRLERDRAAHKGMERGPSSLLARHAREAARFAA